MAVRRRKTWPTWTSALAIVAGACALGWPALYNGFPLLFTDSVDYPNDGRGIAATLFGSNAVPMGWMRGPLYSRDLGLRSFIPRPVCDLGSGDG